MTDATHWSGLLAGETDLGRRKLLLVSAGAAAALTLAGKALPVPSTSAITPTDFVRALPKSRWSHMVELAVLHNIEADRTYALSLLWAALELDLDPASTWRRKRALRLYDLFAAAGTDGERTALSRLVAVTDDPALIARAALWSRPQTPRPRIWRTIAADGSPLGFVLPRA